MKKKETYTAGDLLKKINSPEDLRKLKKGRSRLNCTVKDQEKNWRWFGYQLYL